MPHQRNIYKDEPARAWLRLQLNRRVGDSVEREFLVDTGNPCALIISQSLLGEMLWRESFAVDSNFGPLGAGWLSVTVPEAGDEFKILGYANDAVVQVVQRSDSAFDGLIGLPLLGLLRYGGDQGYFWVENAPSK